MRAMIYTRISSDAEGRELGVARQLEDCTALAERNGWTIVREFRDNDRGASTRSRKTRPEYAAMLAAVAAGEADAIVAYSASRITLKRGKLGAQPVAFSDHRGSLDSEVDHLRRYRCSAGHVQAPADT